MPVGEFRSWAWLKIARLMGNQEHIDDAERQLDAYQTGQLRRAERQYGYRCVAKRLRVYIGFILRKRPPDTMSRSKASTVNRFINFKQHISKITSTINCQRECFFGICLSSIFAEDKPKWLKNTKIKLTSFVCERLQTRSIRRILFLQRPSYASSWNHPG